MLEALDKYKFGIIAALVTYVGIFMYLTMDTYTEYFKIDGIEHEREDFIDFVNSWDLGMPPGITEEEIWARREEIAKDHIQLIREEGIGH